MKSVSQTQPCPMTSDHLDQNRVYPGPCLTPLPTLLATEGDVLGLTAGPEWGCSCEQEHGQGAASLPTSAAGVQS